MGPQNFTLWVEETTQRKEFPQKMTRNNWSLLYTSQEAGQEILKAVPH